MAYVGETRSRKLVAEIAARGLGMMIIRGRAALAKPPGRWAFDNGVFEDSRAGRAFDERRWFSDLMHIVDLPPERRPDFVVLPDIVAGGLDSLRLSLSWLARLGRLALRFALVVQDGMRPEDIPWEAPFEVLFVGGLVDWKLHTGSTWARVAHEHGRTCHVGRVSSRKRIRWAFDAGADSIDGTVMLWSDEQWSGFRGSMAMVHGQGRLALGDGR